MTAGSRVRFVVWLSRQRRRLAGDRRHLAQVVVMALAAGMLVAVPLPAATGHPLPPGASLTQPVQRPAAAAPTNRHAVPAAETAADHAPRAAGSKQVTPEQPKRPPGSPTVVGPEKKIADPPRPDGPMCRGCGPQPPTVYKPGAKTADPPVTLQSKAAQPKGFVAGQSKELVDKRTEDSTTFVNPDGTKTLRVYSGPQNARDASGRMVPIDTRLVRGTDGRYRPTAAQPVSFAASSADQQLATIRLGDQLDAGFALSGVSTVDATANGSDVRYPEVRPGADFVLSANSTGLTDQVVLKSADAPATWRFPLRLRGLTPVLTGGEVQLVDAHGTVQGLIPPGYMVDSSHDPANHGDGVHSDGVTYRLLKDDTGWSLEMAFDATWLHSPARVFPVVADPTIRLIVDDDTYVATYRSGLDFSSETEMFAGYQGNGVLAASYLRFYSAELGLRDKYLLGATLLVATLDSSCTPRPLNAYAVTEDWRVATSWPGPAYDASSPIGSATFSRRTRCGDVPGYDSIPIDPARLQQLELNSQWHGFTLRASSTDTAGWKEFGTRDRLGFTPYLDLLYSEEGASIRLDSGKITPPVTPSTSGFLLVWATNLGMSEWTPTNGFQMVAITTDASGREVKRTKTPVCCEYVHSWEAWFWVELGPEPAGTYTLRLTMQDGAGRLFDEYYGVPRYTATFSVQPESAPVVTAFWPPNNAQVDSLRPSLWSEYYDADRAPGDPEYWYKLCTGGTADAPTGCQETGWIDTPTWTVPAGTLAWSKTAFWYVALYDGANMTYLEGPYALTPTVAQPEITSHLAGAGEDAEVAGLNTGVGNYSTEAVDAQAKVAGPALEMRRTYNSQDPRTNGALGPGWSTPFDQRIDTDPDGSGNVVVTLASGRQVRFGRNADGTFAPPPGLAMTLVRGTGTWTLRDPSGDTRAFDDSGKLTTVTDAYGRQQQYLYTAGKLAQVRDVASGRSLFVGWNGNVIGTVKTDAPIAGGAQPVWTYTYNAGRLAQVCSPLSVGACTQYQYQTSSHYRSLVTDANPVAYYPFSETAGGAATNVVQHKPKDLDGSYAGVSLGSAGALAGTPDPAASFDATKSSAVVLPNNLLTSTLSFAVELWFQAAQGKYGVLLSEQNTELNGRPTHYDPALYVRTDGRLFGTFWNGNWGGGITTAGRVDDGRWHHVVLSVNFDRQDLYLDGQPAGTTTGFVVSHLDMSHAAIGNGFTGGWSGAVNGNDPFTGLIDDVAVYRHPLGQLQASAHYAARTATARLTTVIEPGNITTTTVTYDAATGRVATMGDRNGAQWTLTQPVVGDGTRTVTVASTGRDTVTYTYDADHGGRIVNRQNSAGTEYWWYDDNGFPYEYLDANGRARWTEHDARGNIVEEVVVRASVWQFTQFGYYLNAANPLDPRNDRTIWRSGVRNAWDRDPAHRISYDLDPAGRTTKVTYPKPAGGTANPVETNTFTVGTEAAIGGGTVPAGLLATSVNRLGGATTYGYDARGDLRRTVDPAGLTTEYTYDLVGHPATRTTSAVVGGQTVTYGTWTTTYNAGFLVDTETAPGVKNTLTGVTHTARTTYRYDDAGRVSEKTVSDTTGGDAARKSTYGYDALGRAHTATAPDGGVSVQDWNTAGDLARTVDAKGLTQEYHYDDSRRLIETDAVGPNVDPMDPSATKLVLESRAYDPAGQLASVVDAMGRETDYTYFDDGVPATKKHVRRDAAGNVTSSTLLAQYEYDYGGQLIRQTDAAGVVHDYDYDDLGDRYRETLDAGGIARTTALTFDAAGSVLSRTEGNGITFVTGRSAETPYLFADNGSQIDGAGDRYTDNNATATYKFTLPADTTGATLNLEIDNQFLVQLSADNQHWTEVARETRPITNGSNRAVRSFPLDGYLGAAKTAYVRIGDSQPADGSGAALDRVTLDYTRAGGQPRRTTYGYDAAGRQLTTAVANPGGTPASLVTTTNRDPRGLVTQVIDPSGASTTRAYDAIGNPVTTTGAPRTVWRDGVRTDGFSPVNTMGHNTFGDVTQSKDPYGAVTTMAYDTMGQPTTTTLPPYTPPGGTAITPVVTTTYDAAGNPRTTTDPLGRTTTVDYDLYGRPATRTQPDPDGTGPLTAPVWRYTYDRDGERVDTTDPTGAHTSATYNDLGYADTSTESERVNGDTVFYTTTLGRDDAGRLTSEKSPLGHVTTHDYNPAGEQIRTTDATKRAMETRYDALGHVTATIEGDVRATGYGYDAAGRRVTTTAHTVANGQLSAPLRTSRMSLDALGRPLTATSAEGRITRYGYDTGGNRTSVTQLVNPADPATAVTVTAGYDALGQQTRMVDGNGNATDYLFNDWGLRTAIREPATPDGAEGTWTTTYDAAGQAVGLLAPGGVRRTSTYDGLGRLTDETGAGAAQPTAARHLGYDPLGRITTVGGPSGDETYTWNDRGLLVAANGPAGTATFGYDAEANLASRTDAAGSTTITYDGAGRPATETDPLTGRTATFGYGPAGDLASIGYGPGAPARTLTLDDIGRLATDTLTKADGTVAAKTTYGYDRDDLLASRITTGLAGAGTNTYGHDGLGRVNSWTAPNGQQTTYGYDGASNRTTVVGSGGTRTYTYDARNRLVSASGGGSPDLTNTWSARGTLESSTTGSATTRYGWDAFDRQVSAQAPGHTDTYTYDALDRVAQRNGVAFAYADLSNDAVRTPSPAGDSLVFRAPDGTPMSTKAGGGGQLLTADGVHGDVVAASAPDTGALTASAGYAPDGTVTASNGSLPLGFQGGWTEPDTGLVNAHARWYSPAQASFTTQDELTLGPDPVTDTNRYAYGDADPVTLADPSGNCPFCFALPLAALGGPPGWAIAGGLLLAGGIAFGAACYLQGGCHMPSFGGGKGPSNSRAASPFDGADGAKVSALANAHNSNVRAAVGQMLMVGASAKQIIDSIRASYPTDADVVRITGTKAPARVSTRAGPSAAALLAAFLAAVAGAIAASARAAAIAAADLQAWIEWASVPRFTPAPPIQQTVFNVRPPEIALLPAGSQLTNTVAGAAGATAGAVAIPSVLQEDADGTNAQNAALATTAVAAGAAAIAATPGMPDDQNGDKKNDKCSTKSGGKLRDPYRRPSGYRKGVRDKVWKAAKDPETGKVSDPLTGHEIEEGSEWHMGHKPGYEFRKHAVSARARAITRKQFLEEHNDPTHYWPELPSSNCSHAGEDDTDTYLGP